MTTQEPAADRRWLPARILDFFMCIVALNQPFFFFIDLLLLIDHHARFA
jgi:hypothetical protein